ncbi:MAG TPA: MarR family transcriptional regulator [Devosia sp.]|jgi:DNA-binding MarR family transcriptional regulator
MKKDILKSRAPVGYLIHEVARLMKRRFEDEARLHDITLPQWRTLSQIAVNDAVTQAQLAANVDVDPMTMSGILNRLEKRGLIDRFPDPADSRAKLARLTAEGEALFEMARTVGATMYEAALEGVSQADKDVVIAVLSRMRDNLTGQSAEKEPA